VNNNPETGSNIMNKWKNFLTHNLMFWLFILGCLFPIGAYTEDGDENWYKVELIVFGHEWPSSENFEHQDTLVESPDTFVELKTIGVDLDPLPTQLVPYATVSSRHAELTSLYHKLGQSSEYIPKMRLAWIEPVKKNRFGQTVHVFENNINGFVRLQRGHYLHVSVDFNITDKMDSNEISFLDNVKTNLEDNTSETIYHLKERRRILLGETHYFDHPKFGLIIKVTLLKPR